MGYFQRVLNVMEIIRIIKALLIGIEFQLKTFFVETNKRKPLRDSI